MAENTPNNSPAMEEDLQHQLANNKVANLDSKAFSHSPATAQGMNTNAALDHTNVHQGDNTPVHSLAQSLGLGDFAQQIFMLSPSSKVLQTLVKILQQNNLDTAEIPLQLNELPAGEQAQVPQQVQGPETAAATSSDVATTDGGPVSSSFITPTAEPTPVPNAAPVSDNIGAAVNADLEQVALNNAVNLNIIAGEEEQAVQQASRAEPTASTAPEAPANTNPEGFEGSINITTQTTTGNSGASFPIDINVQLVNASADERVASIVIDNVPDKLSLSAGTQTGPNTWSLTLDELNNLEASGTLNGRFEPNVTVTALNDNGDSKTASRSFNLDITLRGTAGNDVLHGDANANLIDGEGGDDEIYGYAGADELKGGSGNDKLEGGDDNDILRGGAGQDIQHGGAGDDLIFVDSEDRITDINGGADNDTIQLEEAANIRLTNANNIEKVIGSSGADNIDASRMSRSIEIDGKDGDDVIKGSRKADILRGGAGADEFHGGSGNDQFYLDADDKVIKGGGGTDTAHLSGDMGLTLNNSNSIEKVIGSDSDNTIDASAVTRNINIDGGAGDDTITGGRGRGTLAGGDGNDKITGGTNRDTLEGGDGNDNLKGGGNNDILKGGAGADELHGEGGNDTLHVDADDTVVDGGSGTDTAVLYGDAGINLQESNIERVIASDGNNEIDASGRNASNTIDGKGGDDIIRGGSKVDRLTGSAGDDELYGNGGNDTIYGDGKKAIANEGNDYIDGGDGNDKLYGGGGNDTIIGGAGKDTIRGGDGDDTIIDLLGDKNNIRGGDGNDTITSGAGKQDRIYGDAGDDIIRDGAGKQDYLYGGDGDDTIYAGAGDQDRHYGQAGDDLFIYSRGDGNQDRFYGGKGTNAEGENWTDTLELQDVGAPNEEGGWVVSNSNYTIDSDSNTLIFDNPNASGNITLDDGTQLIFQDIEKITWT